MKIFLAGWHIKKWLFVKVVIELRYDYEAQIFNIPISMTTKHTLDVSTIEKETKNDSSNDNYEKYLGASMFIGKFGK